MTEQIIDLSDFRLKKAGDKVEQKQFNFQEALNEAFENGALICRKIWVETNAQLAFLYWQNGASINLDTFSPDIAFLLKFRSTTNKVYVNGCINAVFWPAAPDDGKDPIIVQNYQFQAGDLLADDWIIVATPKVSGAA